MKNHIHCLKICEKFGKIPPLVGETEVTTFGKQYPHLIESVLTARLKNHPLLKQQ